MGRKSHSQTLVLWANGERVGRWTIPARGDMELQYDPAWLASAHYFDNLLPDSTDIRRRVATRFRTGTTDPFDLLRAIGRDCVGAVQLLEEGEEPTGLGKVDAVAMDEEAIERHLQDVVSPDRFEGAGDSEDDFRISLAGAQEKDAFLWWQGRWHKPRGATPTTHIFKLPLGWVGGRRSDFSTSVDNEWLCLKLFQAYGLPAANADIPGRGAVSVG